MKNLWLLSLLTCLSSRVVGKVFGRCELARVLKKAGLEGYRGSSLADWVCLAFYESHFDTAVVDHEADGSTSNGIFQINSRIWCQDYRFFNTNVCQMHCSGMGVYGSAPHATVSVVTDLLTSNINDDIVCAMKIARGPKGLGSWFGWKENCDGFNLTVWLEGCTL